MISFRLPIEEAEKYKIGQVLPVVINGMETTRTITNMTISRYGVKITAYEPTQRTHLTKDIQV